MKIRTFLKIKKLHVTSDGRKIPVRDLELGHLKNIIVYMNRNPHKRKFFLPYKVYIKELKRRETL